VASPCHGSLHDVQAGRVGTLTAAGSHSRGQVSRPPASSAPLGSLLPRDQVPLTGSLTQPNLGPEWRREKDYLWFGTHTGAGPAFQDHVTELRAALQAFPKA